MTIGEEIMALDEVVASLRAIASGAVAGDPEIANRLADAVGGVADRTQEVADLRAALAILGAYPPTGRRRSGVVERRHPERAFGPADEQW